MAGALSWRTICSRSASTRGGGVDPECVGCRFHALRICLETFVLCLNSVLVQKWQCLHDRPLRE
eukprot:8035882-Prorocentrum_lima.AAC.1